MNKNTIKNKLALVLTALLLVLMFVPNNIEVQAASAQVYCPETDGVDSSFFTISGNLDAKRGTINYKGKPLSKCLKVESAEKGFDITFKTDAPGTLVVVISGGDIADAPYIKVDGDEAKGTLEIKDGCTNIGEDIVAKYGKEKADVYVVTKYVGAGEHKITKGSMANIYYMTFTPDESATTEATTKAPTTATTKAPTTATTKAPTTATTKAPTTATTKPTESTTVAPSTQETSSTENKTEASVAPTTQAPTQPSSQASQATTVATTQATNNNNGEKGGIDAVTAVIIVGILIVVIGIVVFVAKPIIDKIGGGKNGKSNSNY